MPKPIPLVTVQVLDFYQLAQANDRAVIGRFQDLLRRSAKPLLPANLRFNACRVLRGAENVAVQLLLSSRPSDTPDEVARVAFVPPKR